MAAPLSGVGQQQQVPLSQPYQPGGSDQTREIRQQSQAPRDNELQARGAAPSKSQNTNTTEKNSFQQNVESANHNGSNELSNSQGRGSVIDIVV